MSSAADRFKLAATKPGAGKGSSGSKVARLRKRAKPDNVHLGHQSEERKKWLFIVAALTVWVPDWVLKLFKINGHEVRLAWREKFALVIIIFLCSLFCILWLEGSNSIFCPRVLAAYTAAEVNVSASWVIANGKILDTKLAATSLGGILQEYKGLDTTSMIPAFTLLGHPPNNQTAYYDKDIQTCVANVTKADSWLQRRIAYDNRRTMQLNPDGRLIGCPKPGSNVTLRLTEKCYYSVRAKEDIKRMTIGDFLMSSNDIKKNITDIGKRDYVIIQNKVYDVTDYLRYAVIYQSESFGSTTYDTVKINVKYREMFLPEDFTMMLARNVGRDATEIYNTNRQAWNKYLKCMDKLYFAGVVTPDFYDKVCELGNPMLLVISGCVYSIVVIKFIVSLSFSFGAKPAQMNAYSVLFVPCYTEGVSMKVTLETLACCVYDDRKKLMVVVCDGNITGKGNAKPTPNIVLDILGWSGNEPEPQYYLALGKGEDKINMAKVYSGLYEFNGHKVPYLVIAKVGKPSEAKKAKPGNRGKRDSQLILMNFFNKLCGDGKPMTPLEYELFYQINYVIGVNPNVYEYCLMVDADTEVEPEGLNALVASMVHDQRKIGVCGETTVSNKWTSWVTWIQVHEYYINHHLGKTFESIFGSVTCLPGCFSMYRIRYLDGEPALVHDKIIEDYKLNKVHTLHSKNLLHLGEDRYLTTLLLKHFPGKRLEFIPSAVCKTDIPDTFEVLLSQRRRWINSTFHNLYELYNLPRLCNFCFISMKYLVLLDLLSTVILPASTLYLYAIVVRIFIEGIGKYTLVLGGALGLYATHLFIILLVKRQPEYCIWITVYIILALPVFSIVLPLYSFWHFDDFSWGSTRQVQGANGANEKKEDKSKQVKNIPLMPLAEYEQQDQRLTNRIPKPLQIVNIITATTPGKKLVDADPLIPTFEVLPDTKFDDNRLAGVSGIPKHFYQQFFSGGGVKPGQLQIPNGNMGTAPNSALTVAVASPPLKEDAALQNLAPPMPITDMTMMSVPANMPPPPLQDLPPIPPPIMPIVGTLRKGAAPPPPIPAVNPNTNMTMTGTVGAAFAEAFSALKQMDSLAEELTEEIPQSQAAAANSQNQMNYAPATVKGFPFTGTLGKPQNDGNQSQGGGSVREKSFVGTIRDQQAQAQQQMLMGTVRDQQAQAQQQMLMGTIRDQQQMAQQQGDMSNFNMPLGGTVNAAFAEAFSGLQQMQNMGGIVELEEQPGYGMQSGNTLSVGMNSTGMYSNDPSQSQFQMSGMQNNMGMNMGMDPNMQQQQYDQQYQMQNDMAYQNQQYGNEMGYQQQYQGDMQYQNDMAYQQQYGNVNDMQYQQQGGYGTVNGMATMNGRMTVGGAIDFTSLLGNNGTDQNQFNGYQQ